MNRLGKKYISFRVGQFAAHASSKSLQICMTWWAISHTSESVNMIILFIAVPLLMRLVGLFLSGYFISGANYKLMAILIDSIAAILAGIFFIIFYIDQSNFIFLSLILSIYSFVTSCMLPLDKIITVSMLKKNSVEFALSLQITLETFAYLLGSVLSGLILMLSSATIAPLISSIGFVLSSVITFLSLKNIEINKLESGQQGFVAQLRSLFMLYSIKTEWYATLITAMLSAILFSYIGLLLPIYIKSVLSLKALFYSLSEVVLCVGVFASLIFTAIRNKEHDDKLIYFFVFIMGALLILQGFVQSIYVVCFSALVLGFSISQFNSISSSKRMLAIPVAMRTQIYSGIAFLNELIIPILFLIVSTTYMYMSIQWIFVVFGMLMVISAPMFSFIPYFKFLMKMNADSADEFYLSIYPKLRGHVNKMEGRR